MPTLRTLFLSTLLIAGAAAAAGAAAPEKPNAVQAEMRALTGAMHTVVDAIASNDLSRIPPALHEVHGAREETEKALKAGTYRPPVNGDRLKAFIAEDEAFHDELVKLVKAARANDAAAAARQIAPIMNGCVSCHATYRDGTAAPRPVPSKPHHDHDHEHQH